jgi:hypothetical protein
MYITSSATEHGRAANWQYRLQHSSPLHFPKTENEAGSFPLQQHHFAAPAMQSASGLPQHYIGASLSDTTQSDGSVFPDWAISAINEVYEFFAPLDETGYGTNAAADGVDLSSIGLASENALEGVPELQSMQYHGRHVTELDTTNRHIAATNYQYGGIPTTLGRTPVRVRRLDCVQIDYRRPAVGETHG